MLMNWEVRLAQMILAGGALATAACSSSGSGGVSFCCNASSDPCCTCDGVAENPPACQQKLACEAEGGSFDTFNVECSFPAEAGGGFVPDEDASDAPPDVTPFTSPGMCCNANPDPCCQIGYCDGNMTAYAICEACADAGGKFVASVSATCSVPLGSGPSDAGADGVSSD